MGTCGHTGRNGSITMKKEVTWGTYLAADIVLRASSESLTKNLTHTEDPQLIGERFPSDMVKTLAGAGGGSETKLHPDTAGILLSWALGGENAVANPPDSYLIINYTGTALNYVRMSIVGTDLTAEGSADGSIWAVDNNFGTAGVYDLSVAANDTTAELAALIEADTDYSCSYVGNSAGVTANIPAFAVTLLRSAGEKVGAIIGGTAVTSTDAKVHDVFPADTSTCLPSYSITVDRTLGTDKSLGFVGSKLNALSLTMTASDLNGASLTISCKDEETDKTDSALTIPTFEAYSGLKTRIFVDELEVTAAKDLTLNINNNLSEDAVIGSDNIDEQLAQGGTIDLSGTVNLTDPTTALYSKRSNYRNDNPMEVIIYMESTENADITNTVPFSVLLRLPRMKFTDFNEVLGGPDRLTISIAANAIKPVSTYEHIQCLIVDQDTTTY